MNKVKIDNQWWVGVERFFDGDTRWVRAIRLRDLADHRAGNYVTDRKYLTIREWMELSPTALRA